mgnify:CR=1 FL=1
MVNGLCLSVPTSPPAATLVSNRLLWSLLRIIVGPPQGVGSLEEMPSRDGVGSKVAGSSER